MKRDLIEVLDRILALVPDEEKWSRLKTGLKSVKNRALYTAPEMMSNCWYEAGRFMASEIGSIPTLADWEQKIIDIWTMRNDPKEEAK